MRTRTAIFLFIFVEHWGIDYAKVKLDNVLHETQILRRSTKANVPFVEKCVFSLSLNPNKFVRVIVLMNHHSIYSGVTRNSWVIGQSPMIFCKNTSSIV